MMRRVCAGMFVALAVTSCDKEEISDPTALAEVGAVVIDPAAVNDEVERRRAKGRPIGGADSLIEEMISSEVFYQKALQEGLDQDPEHQREIRRLLIGRYKELALNQRLAAVEVSEEEIQAEYDAHVSDHRVAGKREVAILMMEVPSEDKFEEVSRRMEEAMKLARIEGFEVAVAKFSEDQASRHRGGKIGWVTDGKPHAKLPEGLRKGLDLLQKKDAVSPVIQSENGLYVMKLLGIQPAAQRSFEKVAAGIRAGLLKQKRDELMKEITESTEESVGVVRFEKRWEALELGSEDSEPEQPPALR